jgi:hypothetical protein
MPSNTNTTKAESIVAKYTLAATATGAIPVPLAYGAIVAENGAMISHVASVMGIPISVGTVLASIGIIGSINLIGRQLFMEGAKFLSWGTGSVWALVALSAAGAGLAGLQTYIIGRLAIEIAKNGGKPLSSRTAVNVVTDCKNTYNDFVSHWSGQAL